MAPLDLPPIRGRVTFDAPLAPLTWFRVGGAARAMVFPADPADLAAFLAKLDPEIPVLVLGLGSNIIIRDGGFPGVVLRLSARAFTEITIEPGARIRAGAGAPGVKLARAAADTGISGFSFLRGVPGSIGGALRMNAGAHGGEIAAQFVRAEALDREGVLRALDAEAMDFTYRAAAGAGEGLIFTEALFEGRPGDPDAIRAEMTEISEIREQTQPIAARTGGSTFKNPPGEKAWRLIDAAGCRGLRLGNAEVSEMHCNFLINRGGATAREIEALGDEVRARVLAHSGVELHWEIRRVGVPA
jgi:UDP-N-acetylmuramate dehydrogenase